MCMRGYRNCEFASLLLGPLFGGATSPPTNLWAIRREWLRIARFDTNPSHPIYARWMLL
eukprot:COSAG01_NODE_856_length_13082_cov_23.882009_5_plen_59_part_00